MIQTRRGNNSDHNQNKKGVFAETLFFALMGLGVLCWIILFRSFLSGDKPLLGDAVSYSGHVQFYLDHISRGVYPLWDAFRDQGTMAEFYLRRIGEFNPFFSLIVGLEGLGASFKLSYRIFLGFYFILGMTGFYVLCRRVFVNSQVAILAFLLLMFSSLSTKPFESYLMLILTPSIWFSYFCVAFVSAPKRVFLLGITFTAMIIVITYIPFYVLTIVLVGAVAFCCLYAPFLRNLFKPCLVFIVKDKVFVFFCALVLVASLLPGLLWHFQSASGEALAPLRYVGAQTSNAAALAIDRVNEGGVNILQLCEYLFIHLDELRPGDFYVPVFAFLVFAMSAFTRISRRLVFLTLWGSVIYLIGVADASSLHRFLFQHVFFFKYFRNLQFFSWLALLPIFILIVSEAFLLLLDGLRSVRRKTIVMIYMVLVHLTAITIFMAQEEVIISTYVAIGISFIFFLGLVTGWFKPWGLAILLFMATVIQPMEVYYHLDKAQGHLISIDEYSHGYELKLPANDPTIEAFKGQVFKYTPYFGVKWMYLLKKLNINALAQYNQAKFLLYDRLEPINDQVPNIRRVETIFSGIENIAFVPAEDVNRLRLSNGAPASKTAKVITLSSPELKVVRFDTNGWTVKTHLLVDQFLVYNGTFHSRWKATIDGKSAVLTRANLGYMGLWVPAGEHVVTVRFEEDWHYVFGYFMTGLFWAVFIYLMVLWIRKE